MDVIGKLVIVTGLTIGVIVEQAIIMKYVLLVSK